jgi:hypothetical protein
MELFAATFIALYAAHMVGDHWVQTGHQAAHKGDPGEAGQRACYMHVLTYGITQCVFLGAIGLITGAMHDAGPFFIGMAVNLVTHYIADRRTPLKRIAGWLSRIGKDGFYQLGMPREGRDDNPSLGTGAYALDQSWHIGWLFVAALIMSV